MSKANQNQRIARDRQLMAGIANPAPPPFEMEVRGRTIEQPAKGGA